MAKPWLKAAIDELYKIALGLLLVAAVTVAIFVLIGWTSLQPDSLFYVIPVLVAAIRWGPVAALTSAVASVAATAFFFYPPNWDFRVSDPAQAFDLVLFIFVAVIASQIAWRLSEAKTHAETESLRQALIDSVSHELRTPLVSILGAATVLNDAPALASNPQLKELVLLVREEAERLNEDIQNLLDATRISSKGIQAKMEWAEPADIVNAAVARCHSRLAHHLVQIDLPEDAPLIHVDSILVQQALVQILDNARKYSPAKSVISVSVRADSGAVRIVVQDSGAGLTGDETAHLWERFFRSERLAMVASGSGLGLWIAQAFITANGGHITAISKGVDRGTTITIELPRGADPVIKAGGAKEDADG